MLFKKWQKEKGSQKKNQNSDKMMSGVGKGKIFPVKLKLEGEMFE